MTTKPHSHASTIPSTNGDTTMTTTTATAPAPSTTPASPPVAVAPAPAPTAPAPVAPLAIPLPPPGMNVPVPPPGFVKTNGTDYRGVTPRKSELAAMGPALAELKACTDYVPMFGMTAPPQAHVTQIFDAANQWSTARVALQLWDDYCRTQEGMTWIQVHDILSQLKPAFDLTVKTNASVKTKYSGLQSLLGAAKAIAAKAVATKTLNKAAEAKGEKPLHGGVGKQRKKAAKNAAYEASLGAPAQPAVPETPTAGATPPTVPPSPAPAPAGGSAPAVANGAANGAARA